MKRPHVVAALSVLALVVMLAAGGPAVALAPAAPAPALAVGPVGFTHVSMCRVYPPGTCPTAEATGYRVVPLTTWAFPVTNPSTTQTARNVSARLLMLDAGGQTLIDTVIPVAGSILPGTTAWVAPTAYQGDGVRPTSFRPEDAGAMGVTTATAAIQSVEWTTRGGRQLAPARGRWDVGEVVYWFGLKGVPAVNLETHARIANPGGPLWVYGTWVAFDSAGRAMGGVRLERQVSPGTHGTGFDWMVPGPFAERMAKLVFYPVTRGAAP